MKTIGLLGGMSWESTVTYYQVINETVKNQLGGLHSAKCLLYSVDFDEIEQCQTAGDWEKSGQILSAAAIGLQKAGADFIIICTNTMHKVAPQIQAAIDIPLLHIADITAEALKKEGIKKIALLGTRYTMEQKFYKDKIIQNGIEVLVPGDEDRAEMNRIIFQELCVGTVSDKSRKKVLHMIDRLSAHGAQGVILGCTEIGLLIHQQDTAVPLFDTTQLHAKEAALKSL